MYLNSHHERKMTPSLNEFSERGKNHQLTTLKNIKSLTKEPKYQ